MVASSKGNVFHIAGIEVAAGERRYVDLPLPHLYTHAEISMPVQVVNGRRTGPRLFVSGALHGDEINGVEIIRRLLRLPALRQLRGTLLAVPVVNVYGFINQSRYLPDRRDLNRMFPGSEKGSQAGRLARLFMQQIVARCTHGIDLHTGAIHRQNLPQVRGSLSSCEATRQMALAFGTPVIVDSPGVAGTLREAVAELDIPMLLYEAGEALRFDEMAIRAGVRGIVRVMRVIGMLPEGRGRHARHPPAEPIVTRSTTWVRSSQSGILRLTVPMGGHVKAGSVLGSIADPFGEHEEQVIAPENGIIIGRTNLPLVHEGEAVVHIAVLGTPQAKAAAMAVDNFQADLDPALDQIPPSEPPIT